MPPVALTVQMYEVGPFSSVDTNGDGTIDSWETIAAARRVYGLTPLSQETRAIDQSWTLNTDPNLKDQHTDQFTLNFEREIARNFSVSATYIYKHSTDIYANIPINRLTGQEWQYERIPFTTASGQNVQLYSVLFQDYNGDGVVDGSDVQWLHDNNTSKVMNLPAFDGTEPKRDYHGAQLVFKKRYSDRWQALASVLYSSSDGMARRPPGRIFNAEGPMFYDDNWMGTLNNRSTTSRARCPSCPSGRSRCPAPTRSPRSRSIWEPGSGS